MKTDENNATKGNNLQLHGVVFHDGQSPERQNASLMIRLGKSV